MMKTDGSKINNKLGLASAILILVICVITTSYALWNYYIKGSKENSIKSATLILRLDETSVDGISLLNTVPISDEKGLETEAYTFTINNTGTINSEYKLYLINDEDTYNSDSCSDKKLNWNNIRYEIVKNSGDSNINTLSTVDGLIDEGVIEASGSNSYTLKLWISKDATNEIMGQHFHGKLKLDAVQEG